MLRLASRLLLIAISLTALPLWAGAAVSYSFETIDVPFPGAWGTAVIGINHIGVLTGQYHDATSQTLGFTRDQGGKFVMLPLLHPHHLNRAGHYTGWYDSRNGLVGFLHRGTEFLTLLAPESDLTQAVGVNDHAEVVGNYRDFHGVFHAFLFRAKTREYITVDPPFQSEGGCGASGINNTGVIVGDCDAHGYQDDHGVFTHIDMPGATHTLPRGINNAGVIAGTTCDTEACHGFTLKQGQFQLVDVPGAVGTGIFAINDQGKLVGSYEDPPGQFHGFVASPANVSRISQR